MFGTMFGAFIYKGIVIGGTAVLFTFTTGWLLNRAGVGDLGTGITQAVVGIGIGLALSGAFENVAIGLIVAALSCLISSGIRATRKSLRLRTVQAATAPAATVTAPKPTAGLGPGWNNSGAVFTRHVAAFT